MYDEYLGQKMSAKDIFSKFAGLAVTGTLDTTELPQLCVTIEFIGTVKEAEDDYNSRSCSIVRGRPIREGNGVIWKSNITLTELVGVWQTSVTADGSMSNEYMLLKSDGTGIFAEANMEPFYGTMIEWYVENDILTINTDFMTMCHTSVNYTREFPVPCMSGTDKPHTKLEIDVMPYVFYQKIENKSIEERDADVMAWTDEARSIKGWSDSE